MTEDVHHPQRRRRRPYHAQPAEGAQRPQLCDDRCDNCGTVSSGATMNASSMSSSTARADGPSARAATSGRVYDIIPTDPDLARGYWRDEYRLNAHDRALSKALCRADGRFLPRRRRRTIGAWLASHRHRALEVGMPETAIGFTPDVGGSWLLAHAPGHAGEYMAATAYRMNAADAIHAGFADTAIPPMTFLLSLRRSWRARCRADRAAIRHRPRHQRPCGPASRYRPGFRRRDHPGGGEPAREAKDDWAEATLKKIPAHSPTALAAAHYSVRMARGHALSRKALITNIAMPIAPSICMISAKASGHCSSTRTASRNGVRRAR